MSTELSVAEKTLKARSSGSMPMSERLHNLELLQNKANAYYKQIADLKSDLKRIGKNPLDINKYVSYSPGGYHYWEEEEDLYDYQKYYAYLMYFRKLVKLVEDEIRRQKRLIKEKHREQNRRNQENHKASRSRPKDC